ncbi:MAG: hypothetical protein CXB60_01450, partial [Spiroplasma poulsonii]|nr:hypothetical protein [Spiroplasma poulsonii]
PKKKTKNNPYSGKKKKQHDLKNTSNYRTRNQKLCNKFFARKKTWFMPLFKDIKNPNFKKYQINSW